MTQTFNIRVTIDTYGNPAVSLMEPEPATTVAEPQAVVAPIPELVLEDYEDKLPQSLPWISDTPLLVNGVGDLLVVEPGQEARRCLFAAGEPRMPGLYCLNTECDPLSRHLLFSGCTVHDTAVTSVTRRYTLDIPATGAVVVSTGATDSPPRLLSLRLRMA